ncbi:MAG: lipid droplet-associated protein [Sciscionella sp.]
MKFVGTPFPLPVRVAAGLALSVVENARQVPRKLAGLPVSLVSQALQTSMRMQQHITELAIKGDDALSVFQPVEETPRWATFDEDTAGNGARPGQGRSAWDDATLSDDELPDTAPDPWTTEERALAADIAAGVVAPGLDEDAFDVGDDDTVEAAAEAPAAFPGYDELSLPQLRARLRKFSLAQLRELLDYECAHADRTEFTGMLTRRIDTVRETRA